MPQTEQIFVFTVDDLVKLSEQSINILPTADVPYKISSTLDAEYALYQVNPNKWKHSATITNYTLVTLKELLDKLKTSYTEFEPKVKEDSGFNCDYYRVGIPHPTTQEQKPYIAECNDIIEALQLTYAEANMFKAIWRTAAARTLGLEKSGNTSLRDAEKIKFFAERHYLRESVNANNTDERIVSKSK